MLSFEDVLAARTPSRGGQTDTARYSHTLSAMTGADVYLKLEHFQRTGSFKIRGAYNRIARSPMLTGAPASSPRAPATTRRASRSRPRESDVDSTIVMPERAPVSKVKATRSYGGNVVLHGRTTTRPPNTPTNSTARKAGHTSMPSTTRK